MERRERLDLSSGKSVLTFLWTKRHDYGNFHLRGQAKLVNGANLSQGGITIRKGPQDFAGYRAQLSTGALETGIWSIGLTPEVMSKDGAVSIPNDTWFDFEIIADGPSVSFLVNGKQATRVTDDRFRKGGICLEQKFDSVIHFKALEMKELPADEPGWVRLWNGTDLAGWDVPDKIAWKVEKNILVGRSANNVQLMSTLRDDFENFHLRAQIQLTNIIAASRGGIIFRQGSSNRGYRVPFSTITGETGTLSVRETNPLSWKPLSKGPGASVAQKTWFDLEIIANGPVMTVKVDGMETARVTNGTDRRGPIRLELMGIALAHFKKIEIKELPTSKTLQELEADITAANEKYKTTIARQAVGLASLLDLLDVQAEVQEAELAWGLVKFNEASSLEGYFEAVIQSRRARWVAMSNLAKASAASKADVDAAEKKLRVAEARRNDARKAWGLAPLPPVTLAPNDSGWVQLFNRRDLKNWTNTDGRWSVKDSVLTGTNGGVLSSTGRYQDFHLRGKMRISSPGASISFRADAETYGNLGLGYARQTVALGLHRQGKNSPHHAGKTDALPKNTWCDLDLIVRGNKATVKINDVLASEALFDGLPAAGQIKLNAFVTGRALEFKKIEIKELPPATSPPRRLAGWGEIIDPAGDGSFIEKAGTLEIKVPAGFHDLHANPAFNQRAPRVLQEVEGDFTIQVRVGDLPKLEAKAAGGGLVVWEDGQKFLRFLRGYSPQAEKMHTLETHWFKDGKIGGIEPRDDAAFVRIQRKGADLHLWSSKDGTAWEDERLVKDFTRAAKLRVGVAGVSTLDKEITFRFDKFKIARAGWVQLFNGETLDGWRPSAGSKKHAVEDGCIVLKDPSYITYHKTFGDFHCRLQAKVNQIGLGAINVRWHHSSDASIVLCPGGKRGFTGTVVFNEGPGQFQTVAKPPANQVAADTWFPVEIIARGQKLIVKVNGTITADVTIEKLAREGALGLSAPQFAPGTVADFKNIEIKELPPPPAVAPFDAKKAREHQNAWAKHLGVEPEITNSIGMKLRLIPPGKFLMGAPADERQREPRDGPRHEVTLTEPFGIGVHAVSVGQFKAFVKETSYRTQAEKGDGALCKFGQQWKMVPTANWQNPSFAQTDQHPVVCVSWNDAKAFCDWLSKKEGKQYALPTDAQWEYACRAGSQARFGFGNDEGELGEHAWHRTNAGEKTHPVGAKDANAWGLHDMHGNAWQWTADWFDLDYYKKGSQVDPTGGTGTQRVCRGGSWNEDPANCRAASRMPGLPSFRGTYVGFRVSLVGELKLKSAIESGFQPLFDGKTLKGWTPERTSKRGWQALDGKMLGGYGHLFTDREFDNFHLRADIHIKEVGIATLHVRSDPAKEHPGHTGYAVSLDAPGSLICNGKPLKQVGDAWVAKAGQRYLLEIIADGSRLIVKLDGKTTVDTTDERYVRGRIILEAVAGVKVEVSKIEIKELPAATAFQPLQGHQFRDDTRAGDQRFFKSLSSGQPVGLPPGSSLIRSQQSRTH